MEVLLNITVGSILKDENNEYKLMEVIGHGGFGIVYKAERTSDSEAFAIKTLMSSFESKETFNSFMNEIKLTTELSSKNIIRYIYAHDGSTYPELPPYIIMEYAEDGSLTDFISIQSKLLSNEELLNVFGQLINGMEAINSRLVHRDIKPDNILISNGTYKITDFGLSKFAIESTRSQTFKGFGTVRYIAPEAWKNEKNFIQMDIYSMGIVFYQLATLRYPYEVDHELDIAGWRDLHLFSQPIDPKKKNPELNSTIASVITKMLNKPLTERFNNWAEIKAFLSKVDSQPSENTRIIDIMIEKRRAADAKKHKEIAESTRRHEINIKKCKLVEYQFEKDIIDKLKGLLVDFNLKYPDGDIKISKKNNTVYSGLNMKLGYSIRTLSGKSISIELVTIIEDDFYREVKYRDFGDIITKTELKIPTYKSKRIMAWGIVKAIDGKGFNILLLENENDDYGSWIILSNTVSGLARLSRIEPFGFEFNEIEKELGFVSMTHIYNSQEITFDPQFIFEFLANYC